MLVAVNCSERKKPPTSSTATITANGVDGVKPAQAAVKAELISALHDQHAAEAEAADDRAPRTTSS